jgi:hypothetical protein
MANLGWKKYINAFLITSLIFATALYIGEYFSNRKIDALKAAESQIAIDILSSETKFALLGELACPDAPNSTLSQELHLLGEKLGYSEKNLASDNQDFINLKKQYSLLEIKDYLLVKKLKDCRNRPTAIIYFYKKDCLDCDKQGYVLTYLREKYPSLRVYSFDYDLELSALKTLADIYDIKEKFPALVIENKTYTGFKSTDDIKALIPEIAATTTAKNFD